MKYKLKIDISLEIETIEASPDTAPESKHKRRLSEEWCNVNNSASETCEAVAGCSDSEPTDNIPPPSKHAAVQDDSSS